MGMNAERSMDDGVRRIGFGMHSAGVYLVYSTQMGKYQVFSKNIYIYASEIRKSYKNP